MNRLPVDMTAVMDYGFERWRQNPSWPVSETEFRALDMAAIRAFDAAGSAMDDAWSDCLWSDVRFLGHLVQQIHALAVMSRHPQGSDGIHAAGDAIRLYRGDHAAATEELRRQLLPRSPWNVWLRSIRRRWFANGHLSRVARTRTAAAGAPVWSIGATNILKDAYLERGHLAVDIRNPQEISLSARSVAVPPSVRLAMETAVSAVIASVANLRVGEETVAAIVDSWSERLSILRSCHDALCTLKRPPDRLLWGSSGNALSRILAHALRRRGTHIVGMQHGHNPVWVHHPYMALGETRGADTFLCGTPGQAMAYRQMAARSGLSRTEETAFASLDVTLYDGWRRHRQARRNIKTVLLPGFPGLARRYSYDWTGFALIRAPLEAQIAMALRAAGYAVVYKPHPETASFMAEVMRPYVDHVATGSFEQAVEEADAAIYLYPFSTTLPYVLMHDLPVLIVDVAGRDWLPEVIALLQRRCAVVTATLDAENRVCIDDSAIVGGLQQARIQADDGFADRFYSSSPSPRH